MPEPTINDILVILARLEQKQDAMNDKLDKLESQTEEKFRIVEKQVGSQWNKLNEHEVAIQLLKDRQPVKSHWSSTVSGLVALSAFLFALITYLINK
jgi:carbonic anhydrase